MARYALRNKIKIKEAYSQKILDRIIKSLNEHFEQSKNIDTDKIEGEPYPILLINDAEHTVNMIAFYVIEITKYKVYKLAFKEFVG